MSRSPLQKLVELGQSPWQDNIHRDQITSGALRSLIESGEITGLTSNPTIFEKALASGSAYDDDLSKLAAKGLSADEIFYSLAIDDIRAAADAFRPVYDATEGKDGFVSLECNPHLAHDTAGTVAEARDLWKRVDRPNLMVKIPATRPGIPAIEDAIAAGINVNVTLIFSLERHEEVMQAYLRGLERRRDSGSPINRIASVASFFVSRVDTEVDARLEAIADGGGKRSASAKQLLGKAAIANAKLAFQAFRRVFTSEAYAALRTRGARVQRPLWASTSTKNPAYPDVYYVEALVGPDTVNTLPPDTIDAYRDHGEPDIRIDHDVREAGKQLAAIERAGVSMTEVTRKLEKEGVEKFAASFDSLLETIAGKCREVRGAKAAAG